jgi:hypothetical protein
MDFGIWNWYEVVYRYTDLNGEKHEGRSRAMRTIPTVGAAHEVRYDPDEPSRSAWIR